MLEFFNSHDGKKICSFSVKELSAIEKLLDTNEVQGIAVDVPLFTQKEIDLIGSFENLKDLTLRFNENKNLSLDFVKSLPVLTEFGVDGFCPTIDFKNFVNLKTLIADWNPKIFKNIEFNKLKELHLWNMKVSNLDELNGFSDIRKLLLNGGGISNLEGVEKLRNLKDLRIINMRKLIDISAISNKNLESLYIDNCKKITEYSSIGKCIGLKGLKIFDSGPIHDLNFISNLASLISFRFVGTEILDGNLSNLLEIPDVRFTPKRKYSHSEGQFKIIDGEMFDF